MTVIPPIPRSGDIRELEEWYNAVKQNLDVAFSEFAMVGWSRVAKTGSNITDIAIRKHNDLQNLDEGAYRHLNESQKTDLTDGGSTILHTHDHMNLSSIGTNTHVQIDSHISAFTNVHGIGVDSDIVGTKTSQNLTEKSLALRDGGTLTIATGVVTVTASIHTLDTEGSASSDDLVTINGGVFGQLLILGQANNERDVTVKTGTGNVEIGTDYVMSNTFSRLTLVYNGAKWVQLARSN